MRICVMLVTLVMLAGAIPVLAQEAGTSDDWCRSARGEDIFADAELAKPFLESARGVLANSRSLQQYLEDARALCTEYSAELRLNIPLEDESTGCTIEVTAEVGSDSVSMWGPTATSDAQIAITRLGQATPKLFQSYMGEWSNGPVKRAFRWQFYPSLSEGIHRIGLDHDGKSSIFIWNIDPGEEAGISLEC